jgi:hypothetical protein
MGCGWRAIICFSKTPRLDAILLTCRGHIRRALPTRSPAVGPLESAMADSLAVQRQRMNWKPQLGRRCGAGVPKARFVFSVKPELRGGARDGSGSGDDGSGPVRGHDDHGIGNAAGFRPFNAALESRIEIPLNNRRDRVLAKQLWVQRACAFWRPGLVINPEY